jgi:alanyl-tRNA synthetase
MLSGKLAYEFLFSAYKSYKSVSNLLNVSVDDVPLKLQSQLETLESYEDKFKNIREQEINTLVTNIDKKSEKINKFNIYIDEVHLDSPNELRNLALQIINESKVDITIIYSSVNGKNSIVGATKKDVKLNISTVITELSKLYGGGASKDENLSIGGGPKNSDTKNVLKLAKDLLLKEL